MADEIIKPTDESTLHKAVRKADAKKYLEAFKMYKEARSKLDAKIIENEKWFRQEYWEYISKNADGTEPKSGTLLNAIINKHADFMDNEPSAVFMAREQNDEVEAQRLSKVVPVIMSNVGWPRVYSNYVWYKIKQGLACYSVTWDDSLENGLGDIALNYIDILRMYWEPNCTDIQDSRYVFVLSLIDTDILKEQYDLGDTADVDIEGGQDAIQIESYEGEDENLKTQKSIVIDCYERVQTEDGRQIVHLTKIANDNILESSMEDEELSDKGIYAHGMYPFVLGQYIPLEGTLEGMGLIDMSKGQQSYIDKMDSLILKNSIVASKQRNLVKRDSGVKPEDITDLSKDVIEVDGAVDESAIRALQADALPATIVNIRENKIQETKELTGNRDFNAGGTTGGVTAMGAITALQEAGNKVSRDMIRASYQEYKEVITLVIELIREFYTEDRQFRIIGEENNPEYITFNNQNMASQITNMDEANIVLPDGNTVPNPEWKPTFRKPVYDIDVIAQKMNPFNTISHNQMMIDLFKLGAFNAEAAVPSTLLLENMIFEGKEKLLLKIRENGDMFQMLQQMQAQMQQMQMQYQQTLEQQGIQTQQLQGTLDRLIQNIPLPQGSAQ